ncbi:response regulator transcription factor [Saccharopolyspora shandongensis]|uniref:response regulator transcription factor n=1 Tax=Saccharopolyspora shandongensis TaxID=418495 RepID=UPI0033D23EC9
MKHEAEARRVLVVDDDHAVRDVLRRYLERSGYEVDLAEDGEAALRLFAEREPDLVVLDLMLPGVGGLEVCRRVRDRGQVPVVMLTALGEESDRVLGLEIGADDYVVKPFSPRELVLRVGSVLRRSRAAPADARESLVDGALRLELEARRGTLNGVELALTGREFDLLAFLLRNPGRAFTRPELLEAVWGWNFGDHSTVTVHMRRLREKIEPDPARPNRISTVWGVGYRYDAERP